MIDDKIEKKVKSFKDIIIELTENYEKLESYKFIEYLVKVIDFKSIYNTNSEEDLARLLNIDNFLVMAQEFFKNNPKTTVSEFLQSITLVSDMDEYDDKNNTVTIATVHSVKGLEFKVVFIVGLEEKMFPIIRTYSTSAEMEEERRLMFVAITRARQRLYLTNAKSRFVYGKRDYLLPSRFLKECELLEEAPISRFETNALNTNFPSFGNMGQRVSFSLKKPETTSTKSGGENLEKKYAVGYKVSHPKFGEGTITSNQGINITKCVSINFESFGIKTLSVEYAPITLIKGEE